MDNLARRQITIPAREQGESIQLRVAAYCRVSTDSADQKNSFAAQNTYYTTLVANTKQWTLVDIYADEGITGTSAAKSPDFQRLLSDCRNGLIDKVLVKSISRFARNTKECLEVVRELKSLGIGILFEEQHIDTKSTSSELLTAVMASLAQSESESISKNVRWGIQKKMRDGSYVASHTIFGFRRVEGSLVIHREEAAYVRYMFKEYLAGKNAAELAQEMMDKSRTDPVLQSYQWSYKTIMRLLRNEKYAGDSLHQKTFMTETLPRRCVDNHGELVQYYVSNSHPAIICRADYDAVQCLLSQRKVRRQFSKVQASPFVGKTVCSKCGKGFRFKRVRENGYLVCRSHAENSGDCEMPPIPEKEIRNAFCRMYYNLQKNNCTVLYGMIEELTVARDRQMLWNTDIIALNKEISDINTQSHTFAKCLAVLDAIQNGSCHILIDEPSNDDARSRWSTSNYYQNNGNWLLIKDIDPEKENIVDGEQYSVRMAFMAADGIRYSNEGKWGKAYTDIEWREDDLTFDDSVKPWLASFQWDDSVAYMDTLTDEDGECVMLRVDKKYKDSDDYDPHYFLYFNFDSDGNFMNAQLQVNLFRDNELSITESIVSMDPKTVNAEIQKEYKRAIG